MWVYESHRHSHITTIRTYITLVQVHDRQFFTHIQQDSNYRPFDPEVNDNPKRPSGRLKSEGSWVIFSLQAGAWVLFRLGQWQGQGFVLSAPSLPLGGIRYGVARVCAKCFSFRNSDVILVDSESFAVSNYSQYHQEERRGKIKLINFVSFLPRLLVCSVQAVPVPPLLERAWYF